MMKPNMEPMTNFRAGDILTGLANQMVIMEAKIVKPMVKNSPQVINWPDRIRMTIGWDVSPKRWWLQTPIDTSKSTRITVLTTLAPKSRRPVKRGISKYHTPAV